MKVLWNTKYTLLLEIKKLSSLCWEICIIISQQISITLLFWVFWLQYRTLKKFVVATIGLIKSAEISLIFLKVCWSQYRNQFFVTSIGQVCWREYVAPKNKLKLSMYMSRKNVLAQLWKRGILSLVLFCILGVNFIDTYLWPRILQAIFVFPK